MNGFRLAFKANENQAFLIENPTEKDIEEVCALLVVDKNCFFCLESLTEERLYCMRKDKAQYVVFYIDFFDSKVLDTTVSQYSSVGKIFNRLLEKTLFEKRINEVRYLKLDNWYDYAQGDEPIPTIPLIEESLDNIGLYAYDSEWLKIYLPSKFILEDKFFDNEFTSSNEKPVIQVSEEHLEILDFIKQHTKIMPEFHCVNNGVIVEPYSVNMEDLEDALIYPYLFFNEARWYMKNKKSKWEEYFLTLNLTLKSSNSLSIFISSPTEEQLTKALHLFNKNCYKNNMFSISRPMRYREEKHKSLLFEYKENESGLVSYSLPKGMKRDGLEEYILEWMD